MKFLTDFIEVDAVDVINFHNRTVVGSSPTSSIRSNSLFFSY